MEIEESYDTPEFILGQLVALKLLGYSYRKIAEQISAWGFSISHPSVLKHWKRYEEGLSSNNRSNCGRYRKLEKKDENKIIKKVQQNRFLTAVNITQDSSLNSKGVNVRTIRRVLEEEGLSAHKATIITHISDQNKEKRLQFCKSKKNWTKKWQRILFTDESWMSLESNHIRYVRRYYNEQLSEDYSIKRTQYAGKLRIMIWAAISFDGPEQLYFIKADQISSIEELEDLIEVTFFEDEDIFKLIRNCYLSLHQRISSVIKNEGGMSGY
ncbi:hypothetical protein ABPG72_011186 [Tetrahymena utriculariae]